MTVWLLPHISFRDLKSVIEARPVALITSSAVWAEVKKALQLPLVVQSEPTTNDREFIDFLSSSLPSAVGAIYAVGDGLPLDVAKAVAQKSGKPLVFIPTAITSDRVLTAETTVSETGQLQQIQASVADEVIFDLELIQSAPANQRAVGIVDVLSIATAMMDWNYANQKGQTTPETAYVPWMASIAAGLAAQALKIAASIGKGETEGLRTLVGLLAMAVQVDNQLGHRRATRGSEHIFADALNTTTIGAVSYAEKVGPGILIAAGLHKTAAAPFRAVLESAGVRLDQLKSYEIRSTVNTLPDYVWQHNAPFTILNDLKSNSPELTQALEKSTLLG
jgi:glycerol-1-phosphate dehydrogenase [NAD(P)+]